MQISIGKKTEGETWNNKVHLIAILVVNVVADRYDKTKTVPHMPIYLKK